VAARVRAAAERALVAVEPSTGTSVDKALQALVDPETRWFRIPPAPLPRRRLIIAHDTSNTISDWVGSVGPLLPGVDTDDELRFVGKSRRREAAFSMRPPKCVQAGSQRVRQDCGVSLDQSLPIIGDAAERRRCGRPPPPRSDTEIRRCGRYRETTTPARDPRKAAARNPREGRFAFSQRPSPS
jgi:hypothetical protein